MANDHQDMPIGRKPNAVFWILGVLFALWNLFGCAIYLMDQTMSDTAYAEAYGPAMAAVRDVYPTWATALYAIAVWVGLLAAILLLLRKKLTAPLFVISLIAAVLCFIPTFTNDALRDAAGSSFWVMPLIVVVLGLLEVWWSRRKVAQGIVT